MHVAGVFQGQVRVLTLESMSHTSLWKPRPAAVATN